MQANSGDSHTGYQEPTYMPTHSLKIDKNTDTYSRYNKNSSLHKQQKI